MKWKCEVCKHVIESDRCPSNRLEPVITLAVPGEKNTFRGFPNTDSQSSASHYDPVCFGGERGENYYQHTWVRA